MLKSRSGEGARHGMVAQVKYGNTFCALDCQVCLPRCKVICRAGFCPHLCTCVLSPSITLQDVIQ